MFKHLDKWGLRKEAEENELEDLYSEEPDNSAENPGEEPEVDDFDPEKDEEIEPQEGEEQAAAPAPRKQTSKAAFGPQDVASIVKATLAASQPQRQEPAKQMTPEEFKAAIKYRAVTEADVATLFDDAKTPAEKAAALNALFDAREASQQMVIRALYDQINGKVTNFEHGAAESKRVAARDQLLGRVTKRYSAFKQYAQVLPEVFEQLRESGWRPSQEGPAGSDEAERKIASVAQAVIRKYNPTSASGQSKHNKLTTQNGRLRQYGWFSSDEWSRFVRWENARLRRHLSEVTTQSKYQYVRNRFNILAGISAVQ